MSSGNHEAPDTPSMGNGEEQPTSAALDVSTTDELQPLRNSRFDRPVEEVIELLSQSKRVFLIGAGCSKCAGLPLMAGLTIKVLDAIKTHGDDGKTQPILEGVIKQFDGAAGCTIEDYMSELVDLLSIADRRNSRSADSASVSIGNVSYASADLRKVLDVIKGHIKQEIASCSVTLESHRSLLRAVHHRLQQGKPGQFAPVDYFTLNYDTLLEDALSLEQVILADGFVGGATGWWRPETYDDSSVQARVFKMHGSIDWSRGQEELLPRRVRQGLDAGETSEPVLIWPAATKYREAQRDPFAQLLHMMRTILRPAPNQEVVLAIMGYSFGDSHINHELDRAIRDAKGRLTVLVFTDSECPDGLIKEWLDDPSTKEQVRIHARRGFYHADDSIESEEDLFWWKFEILARLLGGDR